MNLLRKYIDDRASIAKIKERVDELSEHQWNEIVIVLEQDDRKGVQSIKKRLEKQLDNRAKEAIRMEKMFSYENQAKTQGFLRIAGVDEVGRGPLVGPVVAAAVILPEDEDWSYIDDSKKLSETKREMFYEKILSKAIAVGVGVVDSGKIDEVNILNATKIAMKEAVSQINADYLLIDALTLDDIPLEQKGIIKGDASSASIAAASIVAKVTRDRYMQKLHEKYPMYDFANNKGYGTPLHYEGIRQHGMIPEHRRSFLKNMR